MTTKQAAEALSVSVRRVQAMIKSGLLKARKAGRDWQLSPKAVAQLASQERKGGRPKTS